MSTGGRGTTPYHHPLRIWWYYSTCASFKAGLERMSITAVAILSAGAPLTRLSALFRFYGRTTRKTLNKCL